MGFCEERAESRGGARGNSKPPQLSPDFMVKYLNNKLGLSHPSLKEEGGEIIAVVIMGLLQSGRH